MTLADRTMDVNVRPATVQNPTGREFTVSINLWGWETNQLRRIVTQQLPGWLELFARKNAEYGEGDESSGTALGQRGQFADIWRKIGKLKTAIWEDHPEQLTTEGVDEILLDLIGHCFLLLDQRAQELPAAQWVASAGAPRPTEWNIEPTRVMLAGAPAPDPRDRVSLEIQSEGPVDPELLKILTGIDGGLYTSYGWDDGDRTLKAGQTVSFRQHLGKGIPSSYTILGFDSRQEHGMVCHIQGQVDTDQPVPLPIWTNPAFLLVDTGDEKTNGAVDKGCPNKLTIGHAQASTPGHLEEYHRGEQLVMSEPRPVKDTPQA